MKGTLWIKSQGLGLHMVDGKVASIAICLPRDVPGAGCGPLTGEDVLVASDPELGSSTLRHQIAKQKSPKGFFSILANPMMQTLLLLCAIASIAVPLYWTFQRYQSWRDAQSVEGSVVRVEMNGPFVETLE